MSSPSKADDAIAERPTHVPLDRVYDGDIFDPAGVAEDVHLGGGAHFGPGAVLADREIGVFIEEWVGRNPDLQLDPGRPTTIASGIINIVHTLHPRWTPQPELA